MDIGDEDAPYTIEPIEDPVPRKDPPVAPEPEPVEVPELVPA
jgi:hypothetical protein